MECAIERLGGFLEGSGLELRGPQQKIGLRRVPILQDAVDDDLAPLRLTVLNQSCAQSIINRQIVRTALINGIEKLHGRAILSQPQVTIGEQVQSLLVIEVPFPKKLQLCRSFCEVRLLVPSQRQIEPHRSVLGIPL